MNHIKAVGALGLIAFTLACGKTNSSAAPRVDSPSATPTAADRQKPATAATAPDPVKPPPAAPTTAASPAVNPTGHATKAFHDRVKEYLTFHNSAQNTVPALAETADPARITARERALGEQLMKSRPSAKEGDFFIKEYQPILAKLINDDFGKRPLAARNALIQELPKGVAINVNTPYPDSLPLATFPGNLLKVLPELPPELEYRIVGRHLVMRDVKANVIVDIMRNVFPM